MPGFHPKIVVASSDPHQGALLSKYLRSAAYKVSMAQDWHDCLRFLKRSPDLLLLDLAMREEAWKVLKRVKAQRQNGKENNHGTSILAFDRYSNALKEIKAFQLGIDGYVSKPLIKEELLSAVAPWVQQREFYKNYARLSVEKEKRIKTLEGELKKLKDFTEKISSNMPLSIIIVGAQKNIVYVNQNFCKAMGSSEEELLDRTLEQIFPEPLYGPIELIEKVESVLQKGRPTPRFSMGYHGDDFTYRILPISFGRDSERHAMVLIEKVSELKSLGERVKLSEEKYRTLFESLPDGFLIVRRGGGRILEVNRQGGKFFGENKEKLKNWSFLRLFPLEMRRRIKSSLRLSGKRAIDLPDLSLSLSSKGGRRILSCTVSPIFHKGENALLCIFRDVTERRYLENQIRQGEKTSLLGQFTAGAAHEINNPLAIISSNVQYLLSKMDEGKIGCRDFEEINETLKLIDHESKYCGEIIKNLLAYTHVESQVTGREKGEDKKRTDIGEVLKNSLKVLAHQLKLSNIRIKTQIENPLSPILGNANLLEHVFMNLVWNAQAAMPKGGTLTIQVKNIPKQRIVEVSIKDTGIGIPKANLQKLFTPFFSTKEVGKGTGLGLWVVQSIIQEHHGTISVKSRVKNGSTFILRFPAMGCPFHPSRLGSKQGFDLVN